MRGPAFMLLAILLFAALDTVGKVLAANFAFGQVVLLRYLPVLVVTLPIVLARGHIGSRDHRLHALRAIAMLGASLSYFHAFRHLPLADGYLMFFTGPFMVMAAAHLVLGERSPRRAWTWAAIGFAGVTLAVAEGLSGGGPLHAYAAALVGAVCYAVVITINRFLRTERDLVALLVWPGLVGTTIMLPLALLDWRPAAVGDLGLMVLNGVLWAGATLCIVAAFRHAPASRLAPLEFSAIIWAVLADRVVFGTDPSGLTMVGAAVVIGACLMATRAQGMSSGKT